MEIREIIDKGKIVSYFESLIPSNSFFALI